MTRRGSGVRVPYGPPPDQGERPGQLRLRPRAARPGEPKGGSPWRARCHPGRPPAAAASARPQRPRSAPPRPSNVHGRRHRVPVHLGHHPRAVVPEHVGNPLQRHALGRQQRRGRVTHLVRRPPADARSLAGPAESRRRFDASIGVPATVVNTSRSGAHSLDHSRPASARSRRWNSRRRRSASTTSAGHSGDRRDRCVFNSPLTGRLFPRFNVRRTWITPVSRSTSRHDRPVSSPGRRPIVTPTITKASKRSPATAHNNARASATVSDISSRSHTRTLVGLASRVNRCRQSARADPPPPRHTIVPSARGQGWSTAAPTEITSVA